MPGGRDTPRGHVMFQQLGSFAFRYRFAILVVWIVAAGAALALAPSLAQVGSTDQSSFLPASAESIQARAALERAFPSEVSAGSTTISFSRQGGLTAGDRSYIATVASWITSPSAPHDLRGIVSSVQTPESDPQLGSMMRSPDGQLELMNVNLTVASLAGGAGNAVDALRAHLAQTAPSGLQANVTGSAGISLDYMNAIVRGTDSTLLVTIALVVVILLLVYRAPLAALVPLATIGVAYLVSRGVLGYLANAGWKISSLLDTFVVVLVFGVGTDYTIFLISRFREEVSRGDWHAASQATVRRIGAVITASAATVIVGLGSMAFGQFQMIQTTGPALAIAIFVTLLAGLTFTPALLGIFGHYLFWPMHQRDESIVNPRSFFVRLAGGVTRRPAIVGAVLLVVLLVPVSGITAMRSNFDAVSDLPSTSDARVGFDLVAQHLGKGKIMPVNGVIKAGHGTDLLAPMSLARLRDVTRALARTPGVQSVTSLVAPSGDGSVPDAYVPSRQLESIASGFKSSGGGAQALLEPKVTTALQSAAAYVGALGPPFPGVASTSAYAAVQTDLSTAPTLLSQLRESARVSTQLRSLSAALQAPVAPDANPRAALLTVATYLQELVTAYPASASAAAFTRAQSDLVSLQQAPTSATVADLAAALGSLAATFDAQPNAVLFPTSLPVNDQSTALQAQIATVFGRLPGDLRTLAQQYAALPDDVLIPTTLGGPSGAQVRSAVAAYLSGDQTVTRLFLVTTDDPYSIAAFDTVRRARGVLDPVAGQFGVGAHAYVGGPTAELADTQTALDTDFQHVAAITVLGVFLVLVLLLRAIVAPIYLVLTVLLSYLSTLGLTSWLYQSVLGQPGVNFFLPLMVFVLLVALGSDYNIFLMSRVREESEHRPIREGIRLASGRTGAVITSAGLILAGTFGSMASAPLVVLFQIGVAVAVGVLIDTFLVRSILVPALTTLVGDRAWWPSRLRQERDAVAQLQDGADEHGGTVPAK
ncbi:MAG: MMPL family transporter [Candidatus Limnocylindrales bacterium]